MAPSISMIPAAGAASQILPVFAHSSNSSNTHNSTPNAVIVDLHTTVVIPDFQHYYGDQIIQTFQPPYHALGDGSLVATPFIEDVRGANIVLALFSALAMFFLFNTTISIQFLRRRAAKRLSLFYVLCISQVLGAVAMLAPIITYFSQFVSCTATGFILKLCSFISLSLLMTGILGYKAYRCLNNSRVVFGVLGLLRLGMIALLIVSLSRLDVSRRLSGSCFPVNNTHIMPYIVIVQATESAFICGCFLYAVRKTSKSATYQGRLSIRSLSDVRRDHKPEHSAAPSQDIGDRGRRGWWDYVPEASQSDLDMDSETSKAILDRRRLTKMPKFSYASSGRASQSIHRNSLTPRNQSIPPLPQRTPSVTFSQPESTRRRDVAEDTQMHRRRLSSASSVISRISKYIPRMQLFKEVLRNELMYTAFQTVLYLLMGILMLIGSRQKLLIPSVGWLLCDWLVVSVTTMHSFHRVLRRHEHEAMLRHPAAWDPSFRAELEASRLFNKRRAYSPVSVIVPRVSTQLRPVSNPFEDFTLDASSTPASLRSAPNRDAVWGLPRSPISTRASQSSMSSSSLSSEAISYEEPFGIRPPIDSITRSVFADGEWGSASLLPSPKSPEYPNLRLSVPLSNFSFGSFTASSSRALVEPDVSTDVSQ